MNKIARLGRHLVLDVSPLRRSRDLRCLVAGQLLSTLGGSLTTVAVPYQVYVLTRSSLDVGLVSLATVLPLIAGALLGGSLADAADRRKILLGAQLLTLLCSAGLAVNADTGPALWPLFALPAMAAVNATFLMSPQVPQAAAAHRAGLRSIVAGFSYLRGRPVIQGARGTRKSWMPST
jgi:MFS family permease